MHTLGLMISETGMNIAINSRVNSGELIYRHIDFPAGTDSLAALEEAVYDNPLLTADFHDIYVLIDNNRFFIIDSDKASDEEVKKRIDLLWPEDQTGIKLEAVMTPIQNEKNILVSAVPVNLMRFLRRTFNNPAVAHRMGTLARYYALKSKVGNMGKIHVRLGEEDTTDIFAFGRNGLLLANTFTTNTTDDAAYYTLAVAKYFEFDNESDRVYVVGDGEVRDAYVAGMRRFISMVLPEIFPTEIASFGNDAHKAPFELLVFPLVNR